MSRILRVWMAAATLLVAVAASAETTVPVELQVDLMQRVLRFERTLAAHQGPHLTVALVTRPGNAASSRAGSQLSSALGKVTEVAGKPLKVAQVSFSNPAALKQAIAGAGAQVVYLTPGFEKDLPSIAAALEGSHVVTLSTDGDQVDSGAVIGFELVSARPRIALNLGQARRQGLDFSSDLFRVARVVK